MKLGLGLSRLARDASGNVALVFGLSLAGMLAGSAAAIDYGRYSNARTELATAADAAALAGAKTNGTAAQREAAARQVFEANLKVANLVETPDIAYRNLTQHGINTGFRIEANLHVRSMLGTFTGNRSQRVATAAQAQASFDEPTEIVFVLDTTDSMEGDRIATLKSATTAIVEDLGRKVGRADLLKIGVVPFGQYVNIGTANRSKPWLDVRADHQEPDSNRCTNQRTLLSETNCRLVTIPARPAVPASTCMRDGRPRPCGGSAAQPARVERQCDRTYSDPTQVCTRQAGRWIRWNGCVGSRDYPLETMDDRYDVKIPGIMDVTCGTPIQELTSDTGRVRTVISGLATKGETYLPAGLIWGWRMLSPGEPLQAAPPAVGGARKFMIVVTDGRNTLGPTYPAHGAYDGAGAAADRLTRETCNNIAADRTNGVKVFTIAFEMDGLDAKAILQDCANRTGGAFYDAANAAALRESLGRAVDSIFGVKLTH